MQLFASADREPATYTKEFMRPPGATGVRVDINYTAEGGATATLDFKLQYRDQAEGAWEDITGASIVQMIAVGEIDLTVYPGLTAVANRLVTQVPLPKVLRAVAVVGTDNLTFAASAEFLD
jgi:hypothetical protein